MMIKLVKLTIENIRDINYVEIDFGERGSNHITTIQMANGTGKTTTLSLLKLLFSGKELTTEEVNSYRPTKWMCNNGEVKLDLLVENQDEYTIGLQLDYDLTSFEYYTDSPSKRGYTKGGIFLPSNYRLTEDFVDLFIFNGELASQLLKDESNIATNAISILYGLNEIQTIRNSIDLIKQDKLKNSETGVKTDQGLKQEESKLGRLRQTLEDLKSDRKIIQDKLSELNNTKITLEKQLADLRSPEINEEIENLSNQISEYKQNISVSVKKLLQCIKDPAIISPKNRDSLLKLKQNMEKLKLPRGTSKDFFDELCESKVCVCGRPIDDSIRQQIQINSKNYLSDDLASAMNYVKGSIMQSDSNQLAQVTDEINSLIVQKNEAESKKSLLIQQTGGKDSNDEYSSLSQKYDQCVRDIYDCESNLDVIDADQPGAYKPEDNIKECERKISELELKIAKSRGQRNYIEACNTIQTLFNTIYLKSLDKLKKRIISETNSKLESILGNEVKIESIDRRIKLQGKSHGSEGQELIIGYTYITSLFEGSDCHLPFVIDSPCGSLDLQKRSRVAKIVPPLFEQVVFLVTSSERNHFTDVIQTQEDIHPITIWKRPTDSLIESSTDIGIFNAYQKEAE